MITLSQADVKSMIPARKRDGHKGTFGKVYALCGTPRMFGAAVLSLTGALRSGAGLCTVGGEEELCRLVISSRPEAVAHIFSRCEADVTQLAEIINKNTAAVIGSGLGQENHGLVRELVPLLHIPLVIDADGIRALCRGNFSWDRIKAPFVITPHPGEMGEVCGQSPSEINRSREEWAVQTAKRIGGTVLLKGNGTVITDGETVYRNPTGNDGMATPGSGDVLGGVIAGLAAQGADLFCAAAAGAYLHGLAGDIAAGELSPYGVIASDIASCLPKAFKKMGY